MHERPSWLETTLIKDHTDERPPWSKTILIRDHADERPPWWETTFTKDNPDDRPSWWETTLMKDHLMRDHQLNERPPWWETTLMKDYSVEMPHWWKTGLRDQPSFKSTCSDSTCFEKHFSLRKKEDPIQELHSCTRQRRLNSRCIQLKTRGRLASQKIITTSVHK